MISGGPKIAAAMLMFGIAVGAHAWEMNPLDNRYRQGSSLGLVPTDPLHETITWNALDCAVDETRSVQPDGTLDCDTLSFAPRPREPGNFDSALIRGVWWNDDPNQLLNSVHHATWLIYMKDGARLSKIPGRINATYKMQYRSHYGDLQFLHAMASQDGEAPMETQRDIMNWMEFAYAVSTKHLDAQRKLGQVKMPVMEEYFTYQSGWSINYLFRPKYFLRGDSLPDNALGTMLHVVQDSFAGGHLKRDPSPSSACQLGSIVQFRAYQTSDSDKHSIADQKPALLATDQHLVDVSARLIRMQREGADWTTVVKPFLENVFCIDERSIPSGPGEYAKD